MNTTRPNAEPEPQSQSGHQRTTMIVVRAGSGGSPLPLSVLEHLAQYTDWVRVVADGLVTFSGTPADLAATSIDADDVAGEHPLETSLRLLLTQHGVGGDASRAQLQAGSGQQDGRDRQGCDNRE